MSRALTWFNEIARVALIAITPIGVFRAWPMHLISPALFIALAVARARTGGGGAPMARALLAPIVGASLLLGVLLYFAERWVR